MNKKAMLMLYFCVFGFVAAAFLFFRSADDYTTMDDLYLGEKQIQVFQTYQEADNDIYYIQHSALLCSKKVSKENFKSEFESCLNSYLKYLELTSNDFDITYSASTETTIAGISKKALTYKEDSYTYTIYPTFKVEVPYTITSQTL